MKIGTKSVLIGAHCFFIHPFFVAWAWWRMYGFPWDYRLWCAFFVHDLGYWGKGDIDGQEGKKHPELGGVIMECLFGEEWGMFTLCHSRHYAKMKGLPVSPLCFADKMALKLTPSWLYLPLVRLTGEIDLYYYQYSQDMRDGKDVIDYSSVESWYRTLQDYFESIALKEVNNLE